MNLFIWILFLIIIGRIVGIITSETYVDFWHNTDTKFCATSNITGGYDNSIFEISEPIKESGSAFRNCSSCFFNYEVTGKFFSLHFCCFLCPTARTARLLSLVWRIKFLLKYFITFTLLNDNSSLTTLSESAKKKKTRECIQTFTLKTEKSTFFSKMFS